MFIQLNKYELRKRYAAKRIAISAHHRRDAALAAVSRFIQHPLFIQSHYIACYMSFRDEFDTQPFMKAIWQAKKLCYLPVLTEAKTLYFVNYEVGDTLELNQYSIYEPQERSKKIPAENLDLVILPLIAFDRAGHRIGTGGGYYDRTFAFLHAHPVKKPFMMGLGYSNQEIDFLPADPWDIMLDGVITETEIILSKTK